MLIGVAAWLLPPVASVSAQDAAPPAAMPAADIAAAVQQQANALNLPEITVMGEVDPNIRKATAIVNGDVITDTDIDHRLGLVVMANGGRISDQERQLMRLQVLRNLIDEKLEMQEAGRNDIRISDAEVDDAYLRVAANFNRSPEEFAAYLKEHGSSPTTIKQQIRGELAWSRLLRARVEPLIDVGDDEVRAIIQKLEAAKGLDEYRVGEIFLSATPETMGQVMADAQRIVDQVRQGASFVAYAHQFSEASTAAVGGDLGWVRPAQLSPALGAVLGSLQRGAVSDPVAGPGGVTILAMIDKRQVLSANPADAMLSLKQLTVPLPKDISESAARDLAASIQDKTRNMGGCGRAEEVAHSLGASIVSNDQLRLGDLPDQLQQVLGQMPVGTVTPPFGSAEEGLHVLVLCGRDDPQEMAALPSFDQVYSQLNDQRVNSAARRYLRDLRRDAVIDYR